MWLKGGTSTMRQQVRGGDSSVVSALQAKLRAGRQNCNRGDLPGWLSLGQSLFSEEGTFRGSGAARWKT